MLGAGTLGPGYGQLLSSLLLTALGKKMVAVRAALDFIF